MVSLSSAKVEYRVMVDISSKILLVLSLLHELRVQLQGAMPI